MQYVIIYILAHTLIRAGAAAVYFGVPFSFLFALLVTHYSQTGGNGSLLLVSIHCFGKVVQYFGENDSFWSLETDREEYEFDHGLLIPSGMTSRTSSPDELGQRCNGNTHGSLQVPVVKRAYNSAGDLTYRPGAMQQLSERGQEHSSLVSLGLPPSLQSHWAVKASRRNLSFFGNLARSLAVTDSFLSSILRMGTFFAVVVAVLICSISIASVAQQRLNIFPQLISFHKLSNQALHFDHRVVNVTLYPTPEYTKHQTKRSIDRDFHIPGNALRYNRSEPYYAACDWTWESYSLLDFALLSELAYFDDPQDGSLTSIVNQLFPGNQFVSITSHDKVSSGPLYLEVATRDLTIIAIRGTDIGRLRDFMEDAKLFGEPFIFHMLSAVFPTIRFWSTNTAARVIEWLFELNSFFGLHEEPEYYKPLVERVLELSQTGRKVIITGHSLGGGLARIVGALTDLPSVSFSPPGLAMSHRKYSVTHKDGSVTRINSRGIHGKSLAVVTDHDFLAQVDHQVGLVQRIVCDKDDKAHQNSCHLLEGTICHILEHCGDRRHRFSSCEFTYDITAILPTILSLSNSHLVILLTTLLLGPVTIALAVIPDIM